MPKCFKCGNIQSSLKLLIAHFRIIHKLPDKYRFKCIEYECGRLFPCLNSFKKHHRRCHKVLHVSDCNTLERNIFESRKTISDDNFDSDNSNVDDIGDDFSVCNPFLSNEEFKKLVSDQSLSLICKIYAKSTLPRSQVQVVIDTFENCMTPPLCAIRSKILAVDFKNENEQKDILEMIDSFENMFDDCRTEYIRFKTLEKSGKFITPEEVVLGDEFHINSAGHMAPKSLTFQFIPPRLILKQFFELDNVFNECFFYYHKLSENNITDITNIVQSDLWKSKIEGSHGIIFPILIYFDELEIGNPLGSHSGIHKLGATYCSVPVIPRKYQSQLENIFLIMLFHSQDHKKFGNGPIFSKLIDELNFLENTGITVNLKDKVVNIKFKLMLVQGDNLGLNMTLGFSHSFNASYFCRFCKIEKKSLKNKYI